MGFYFVIKLYKNHGGPNGYTSYLTVTDKDNDGPPLSYEITMKTIERIIGDHTRDGWSLMSAAIEMI